MGCPARARRAPGVPGIQTNAPAIFPDALPPKHYTLLDPSRTGSDQKIPYRHTQRLPDAPTFHCTKGTPWGKRGENWGEIGGTFGGTLALRAHCALLLD